MSAMPAASFGSRAKPMIITRLSHAIVGQHSLAIGISSARHLAQVSSPQPPATTTSISNPHSVDPTPTPSPSPGGTSKRTMTTTPINSVPKPASQPTTAGAARVPADDVNEENITRVSASSGGNTESGRSKSESFSRASTWLWRTIYLTAGVSAAGIAAQCVVDPAPVRQAAQAVYDNVDTRLRPFTKPSRDKLLPDAVSPYANVAPPRTLLLELEDTLVHSTYSRATGWRVAKRPGAEAFLAYLASMYEIVIFTSNIPSYANPILSRLDPQGCISHTLYRSETHFVRGTHMKDLTPLNRPLSRVVLIDCNPKAVELNEDNAIIVPKWTGDPSDTTLLDLIPLLEGVVREDVPDLRVVLRDIKGKIIPDAVAEYRALAAARAQRARPASLFGHVADSAPQSHLSGSPLPSDDAAADHPASSSSADGDLPASNSGASSGSGKSSLWGSLPGRSKIFNTPSTSRPAVGNAENK